MTNQYSTLLFLSATTRILDLEDENALLRKRLCEETARALHAEAILSSVKENILNFEKKYDEVI